MKRLSQITVVFLYNIEVDTSSYALQKEPCITFEAI